ncbi:hypothetical protein D6D01_05572 [Aureobasidium pullulans]|uniref:Long chronological lifespan protein 2 n=1 Tax=Aureobasidium pullulans TaxID=5580 RepID=A0A4S9L6Y1_AURPU|nr:hypothetical protein D6D01_05572 [Aureobasidium pullulans]
MKTPSPPSPLSILFTTLLFILPALAQFQFFDQMFNQQQQQQQPQNAGSDSAWYRQQYDTGGYKAGEAGRKIQLARKGLL